MLGGVYSKQRCPICKSRFVDDGKKGLFCPDHPDYRATNFFVRFIGVFRRFSDYQSAQRFLTGLRYEYDKGTFDERDYRKENPLGFQNLTKQWLELRKENMLSIKASFNHMNYAIGYFGARNIKEIRYAELEDFFHHLKESTNLSDKTRFNIKTTLHSFWTWAVKRNRDKAQPILMPDFPDIKFKLAYRQTVTLDIQDRILDEVGHIAQRREWLAIRILSTYPKIRPGELWKVKEKDIDLDWGVIRIQHPKSNDPDNYKEIKLLDEDVELIKSLPKGFPEQYFLRHDEGKHVGQRYGTNYLNNVWKKACCNLGVSGVSLYPGTKHSTVRGMRKYFRPDEIRKGTGIVSNKAFERYFMTEYEDELKLYRKRNELRKPAPNLHRIAPQESKGKLSED